MPAGRLAARVAAAAATVALLAAGCGGASDPGPDRDAGEGEEPGATPVDAAPVDAPDGTGSSSDAAPDSRADEGSRGDSGTDEGSRGDSGEPERLADYLGGFGFGSDPEQARAYYERQERRVQELIARCMAEEGFEYIPAARPVPAIAVGPEDQVEFARERGFGITTYFGEEDLGFGGGEEWTDPNQAIVEALSDSERQAYYDTLWAPPEPAGTETDPETGEVTEVYEGAYGQGCQGQAYEEVFDEDELNEVYEQLDLESMWERIEADPRVRELYGEWSGCMGDRGYGYDAPEDLYESVFEDLQARLEEIVGPGGGYADPFEGLSDEEIDERMSTLSQEEMEDLYESAQREARQNVDQAALSALQDEERALAVANAECSTALAQAMDEVVRDYEAELIEANRALLEDYRAGRGG